MKLNWKLNSDVTAFIKRAATSNKVAFDVETDTTDDKNLKLMQFGLDNGEQYLFTPDHLPNLKQFLEQTPLIAHNAIFEISVLAKFGIYPERWTDTMLNERIILGGDPNHIGASLDKCMERYLGIEMSKTMQTAFGQEILTKAHYNYAAGDVAHLHDLLQKQEAHPDYNYGVVELEHCYLNVVAEMSRTGMRVDVEGWQKVVTDLEAERAIVLTTLDKYKADVNWNSSRQKLIALQEHGLRISSTGKDILVKYAEIPIVRDLLKYNDVNSRITKLGKKFLMAVKDGKIHTSYNQILNTGRTSSRSVNLQNIPKSYRHHFSPSVPGNVFVAADYSQQELIILGFAAGEESWIDAARNREDLHSFCAKSLWPGFDDMSDEQKKESRTKIKAINFSLAYGTGLRALAKQLKMPYNATFELVNHYFREFPKVEAHLRKSSLFAKETGCSYTLAPFKRKRIIGRGQHSSIGRKGKNSPIQGSAADMMKAACVDLHLKELPINLVHNVHDEILVECDPKDAEMVKAELIRSMEDAGDEICPDGLIHCEATVSSVWPS